MKYKKLKIFFALFIICFFIDFRLGLKSNDLNKIEQYLKICSNNELINKKYFKKLENPKV